MTFISLPSVLFDVINFAGFNLNFLYVIITTKCVDCGGLNAHGWEKADLAGHRCAVVYVFVDVFEYSSASGPSKYNLPILLPPNSNQNMLFVKFRYKLFYSEYDLNSSDCVIKFA